MYSEYAKIIIRLDSFSKQMNFRLISVFKTTALVYLPIYNTFLWLLFPDLIGSLMRLKQPKPRFGPSFFSSKECFLCSESSPRDSNKIAVSLVM